MCYSLLVLHGSLPGVALHLDPQKQPLVTIGRNQERDLQLDDERASRLHARVIFRADHWHIEDCSSLNGTRVNSRPIEQTVLESGDLIRIGERLILFAEDSHDAANLPRPSRLQSTTMIGKLAARGASRAAGAPVDARNAGAMDVMSRVVRDSAVLCRAAHQLHRHTDAKKLFQVALESLIDGIAAEHVSVWLFSADGRLEQQASAGQASCSGGAPKVLASLAIEKNKALLMKSPERSAESTLGCADAAVGPAIATPIMGEKGCRGAIVCERPPERGVFDKNDLDFTIVVSHQTGLALENLEHRERLERANTELRRRLDKQNRFVGSSAATANVLDQVARVGPTDATVLILGESGTGKELAAQLIHGLSRRSNGPYIAVNCAAFSDSLLESELFGHEAGAFTGAQRRHIGKFERAHSGAIFLDEVGEMSAGCQAKLLRLLEGHPFMRLGGQEQISVDVRIIAATHRDLKELVREGVFREDLYYRLRVIDICLPPLRERDDDAVELASMFL